MNDTQYLNEVISHYKKLNELTNLIPIAIYNTENKLVFSSSAYEQVREGGTENGLPLDKGFYKQEQSLIEQSEIIFYNDSRYSINFNQYENKFQPYITSKSPIRNKDTKHVIGVRVVLQKIFYTNIKFSILSSFKIYALPEDKELLDKYKLTRREKQVIFLFLNGLTSQEIADVLSKIDDKVISKNAIDAVFANQLRLKFEAYTREGLYQKLVKLGFYNMIPQNLMNYIKLETDEIHIY